MRVLRPVATVLAITSAFALLEGAYFFGDLFERAGSPDALIAVAVFGLGALLIWRRPRPWRARGAVTTPPDLDFPFVLVALSGLQLGFAVLATAVSIEAHDWDVAGGSLLVVLVASWLVRVTVRLWMGPEA